MSTLPQPSQIHPLRTVENVYDVPDTEEPDLRSRNRFEKFLADRYRTNKPTVERGVVRVWAGSRRTLLPRHFDRWGFWGAGSARGLFAAVVGVNLIINGYANAEALGTLTKAVVDAGEDRLKDIYDRITGDDEPVATAPTPTDIPEVVSKELRQSNVINDDTPDAATADRLLDEIAAMEADGRTIESVTIFGEASDEWLAKADGGLGKADAENAALGLSRASRFAETVEARAAARGMTIEVGVDDAEVVLSPLELATLEALSRTNGYAGLADALRAQAAGQALPVELKASLAESFGENRGVGIKVTSTYEAPVVAPTPAPAAPGTDMDWKFIPFLLLPVPLFMRGVKDKYKTFVYKDVVADPEEVLLYPEARKENGELIKGAWQMARKYKNLMREDDRITQQYRLNYVDAAGDQQCLRAIFVDHEPTAESLAMVQGMLKQVSLIQGGRVGRELDMIAVYPTETAGRTGDYKMVNLGIDIQEEGDVLGIAYPGLGLVEVHMPSNPTPEQLNGFFGARYRFAHEIAGHFTDLNEEPNRLEYVGENAGARYFVLNNRFLEVGREAFARAHSQELRGDGPTYEVERGVRDLNGTVRKVVDHVTHDDPRLGEALKVRKSGFPTAYSAATAAEYYAEVVTEVVTQGGIPFKEAANFGAEPTRPADGFADTYTVERQVERQVRGRLGAMTDRDELVFADGSGISRTWHETFGPAAEDGDLHRATEVARSERLPEDRDLLHIIVGRRFAQDDTAANLDRGLTL